MTSRIEDHAVIGDCHTAALVDRDGSIDWLCLPRFDSGAAFAALLGNDENGSWKIAPTGDVSRSSRQYRQDTLVLETEFETDDGSVRIIDFMPPRDEEPTLVRIVEGLEGTVPMRMDLTVRFDYGSVIPWVRRVDGTLSFVGGPDSLWLHSDVETRGEDLSTVAEFDVSKGERAAFTLVWRPSHQEEAPDFVDPVRTLTETCEWWTDWVARCTYEGPHRDEVVRSLITLKSLIFRPTGGIVAAPTTSLPEQIGGERNWDYRFCWVRDATFTLLALMAAGYRSEAVAWRDWLLRALAGHPGQLQIMYGPAGERRLAESELAWLPGYRDSSPVRTGNGAVDQFQLDVFGELMDAMHQARARGISPLRPAWDLQTALIETLEGVWDDPDDGIWEIRGPRRHFTHSKVMAWVAVDRAVKAVENFDLPGPVDRWRSLRDRIHRNVCENGYDSELGTFTQYYGSSTVDASLLMIPLVGFLPADDERVLGTIDRIQERLSKDGLIMRYLEEDGNDVDGLSGDEGAFLPCSFWMADTLWLAGRHDEARELFERLVDLSNDVGLYSEEFDANDHTMLGNFPQAFTHVSMVNTAINLSGPESPLRHRSDS